LAAVKLDENIPDSVAEVLHSAGHEVLLARDEQLAGTVDDRLLEVASTEGRVLVTLDTGFADILRHPPIERPGIVVLRLHHQTFGLIQNAAIRLGILLGQEPVEGRLWVLDESRLRIWPATRRGE
jgi:predicted nuclease of predicted toxin-antitoxin system